jgi:hypothetical protein
MYRAVFFAPRRFKDASSARGTSSALQRKGMGANFVASAGRRQVRLAGDVLREFGEQLL